MTLKPIVRIVEWLNVHHPTDGVAFPAWYGGNDHPVVRVPVAQGEMVVEELRSLTHHRTRP